METLFNFMSPRYLLYTASDNIMEHIELYKNMGTADFIWNVTKTPDSNTRTVTICATGPARSIFKDCGDIYIEQSRYPRCQIFTWRNNIALDIFEVKPPLDQIFEKERWEQR